MSVRVSVVICTRNRPNLIGPAVESVLNNRYPYFDLVIIDQSDNDLTGQTVRALTEEHPNVRYIHSSVPGLSRAANRGVRESSGPIVAFTDDDCVVASDWLTSIVTSFEANPDVDMLYGQVLRAPSLLHTEGEVPELPFKHAERLSQSDGFRIYGMGANFAARRTLLARLSGFDEALGSGGPLKSSGDFDFQYRVFRAGATVLLCPNIKVDHYGLRNYASQWPATQRDYGYGDGAFYFKHVRCGDLVALKMMLKGLLQSSVSEALSQLGIRPRPSRAHYLRSYALGMWGSLRFSIDRPRRLYRTAADA